MLRRGSFLARAIFARGPVVARLIETGEIAVEREIRTIVALVRAAFPAFIARPGALFVLPHAAISGHAEIMISKLQVIFGLHAVTVEVRVLRQLTVFFEQLGGIAARPAVDPVQLLTAAPAAAATGTLPVAAPAPTVITIAIIAVGIATTIVIIQGVSFPNAPSLPMFRQRDGVTLHRARPVRIAVPASAELCGENNAWLQMLELAGGSHCVWTGAGVRPD